MTLNLELILPLLGLILGTVAQIMLWAYIIDSARGARMIDFSDFRININLCFMFCLLVLSFLYLTGSQAMAVNCGLFLLLHTGLWVLTLIGSVITTIFCPNNRDELKSAITSSIYKLVLCVLAIWIVL